MRLTRALGKVALLAGSALVLFAAAIVESVSFPSYAAETFMAAAGLTAIIAGIVALAN